MCGLICVFDREEKSSEELVSLKGRVAESLMKLNHRGPDEYDVLAIKGAIFGHTRLSIVDLKSGHQPFSIEQKGSQLTWIHNGEIYNHLQLKEELSKKFGYDFSFSHSDSSSIGPLIKEFGLKGFDQLDGVFGTVLMIDDELIAARDPLGVKPLFYGYDQEGRIWFSSEMKAIVDVCDELHTFPPGTAWSSKTGFLEYYKPEFRKGGIKESHLETIRKGLREGLIKATQKRLMADVEVGSLLSGGLDSSLVAAIAARELKKVGKRLHTYSIGMDPKSLDLFRARQVAEHIGSIHHEILFTEEEGKEAIKEMITLLETYDVTTIRASTPMYLMSKVIARDGIKVVLSGEGADEIFGGYLYFAHAPTSAEFHEECIRRIGRLHTADLLRADRSTMGASVEARVPFLDKAFLETAMKVDPEFKMITPDRCEKWILRTAFQEEGLIPDEVLWRQKEQFSDGVGYSWVDGLKALAEKVVSDELYAMREELYPHQAPFSKEGFMYRELFAQIYPHPDVKKQVKRWIPKWQDYNIDPSGRANTVHVATVEGASPKVEKKHPSLALVGK